MKIKDLSKEELETMGYDDIAYRIIQEEKKKTKLPDLFKKICKLLELSDSEYEEKIGDFFQLISRDQRFTMLDGGYFDLKEKYQTQVIMTDDEDEEELQEESEDDIDLDTEDEEEENYYDEDSDDDPGEDDLKDLVIIGDDVDDEANIN